MTIVSKGAAGLSLFSCFRDIHKTALIHSKNAYAQTMGDTFVADSVGGQKTNYVSHRGTERKNWFVRSNFFNSSKETFAKIGGYVSGFAQGLARYLPNITLSSVAMCAKNKYIANIAAVLLGGVELFGFIKNSTNLTERTDYLK